VASLAVGEASAMYAQAGVMRAGASRANDHSQFTYVAIAGVQYANARAVSAQRVKNETLTITETEGETPNTAAFAVRGFTPTDGQDVVITLGSINNAEREFAGTILTDAHTNEGSPLNGQDAVNVIDYTWQLTRRSITQRWTNTSGTVIARAIIALAPGFTSLRVEENLAVLDEFTVTNQTLAAALGSLAQRLGAYWKATYLKDVRFGISADPTQTDPIVLTPAAALLAELNDFSATRDLSQVITRQPVEGGGSTALIEVPAGETMLPVEDASWYNSTGGTVVSGPQRVPYTGVQLGGAGSIVGPSAAPAVAPVLTAGGGSVESGVHQYAYVFGTGAGTSLPSPLASITTDTTTIPPPAAPTVTDSPPTAGALLVGQTYKWLLTLATDATHETTAGTASAGLVGTGHTAGLQAAGLASSGVSNATLVRVYRTIGNGATYYLETTSTVGNFVLNPTAELIVGVMTDAVLVTQVNPPGANTANYGGASVTGIALGPTGTTYREVYRTAAGAAQLKLLTTIANNTSTGPFVDTFADATLGANAPAVDTSGLSTVVGKVLAGATSVETSNAGRFSATGGWAINGTQFIRYTGVSGNTLTGIPASGRGAIVNTMQYGEHLDPAPALTGIPASGVGAILYTIKQGDPVNLRVVVDDVAAQAAVALMMLPLVDDGVIEGTVLQDGRISETEARARGTAQLALRSALAVSVAYTTRDLNTHAGRSSGVNLPAAPTSTVGTFRILSVTSTGYLPARWPTRQVVASSVRYTLEMLLRRARGGA